MPISRTDIPTSATLVASNPILNTQLGDVFDLANANEVVGSANTAAIANIVQYARGLKIGLLVVPNSATPASQIDMSADALGLVTNGSPNDWLAIENLSGTLDFTKDWPTHGEGRDTIAIPAGAWLASYFISNDDGSSTATIISGNGTAPVLPSGYTRYRRVAFHYNDLAGGGTDLHTWSHTKGSDWFYFDEARSLGQLVSAVAGTHAHTVIAPNGTGPIVSYPMVIRMLVVSTVGGTAVTSTAAAFAWRLTAKLGASGIEVPVAELNDLAGTGGSHSLERIVEVESDSSGAVNFVATADAGVAGGSVVAYPYGWADPA